MLKVLSVWNFALLSHIEIEFDKGLNILTGETGAGKSILIDSLGAILGARLNSDYIRNGSDWLRIEAEFSINNNEPLKKFLEDEALNSDDDSLIIKRQLSRNGKSTISANGSHITLTTLKKLGALLVDIHGQNENLALLKESNQYALLDESDKAIQDALLNYQKCYHELKKAREKLTKKEAEVQNKEQKIEMLNWQKNEIEEANLKKGEDEELEEEIKKLANAEKIASYVETSNALLNDDSGDGKSILETIAIVKNQLTDMNRFDSSLKNALKLIEEAEINLQEAGYEISDYNDSMDFSPERLSTLQNRMDIIQRLQKKYGETIEDILKHYEKIKSELLNIENFDEDMLALKKEIGKLTAEIKKAAANLTEKRKAGAKKISEDIEKALYSLGMPNAKFKLQLTESQKFTALGKDELTMVFSANLGEEPKPLQKVASGGELSRIALAIKSISAKNDTLDNSMVFDEIDTGIGGKTAQMVAERIAIISHYKQVLCITHLPQIAAMADVHLYISKSSKDQTTETTVRRLKENESVNEIARMASGVDATAAALDNAREMLMHAKMLKQNIKE